MTVKDLLKRLDTKDYDKVILISDGIGWLNISGKLTIDDSTIKIVADNNTIFSDDK